MSALGDAVDSMIAAANTVTGLRGYYGDNFASLQLPAVVVGLPSLEWQTQCGGMVATFPVTLVIAMDDRVMSSLFSYVEAVQAAIETSRKATVTDIIPVSYNLDNGQAVGFELTVQYDI